MKKFSKWIMCVLMVAVSVVSVCFAASAAMYPDSVKKYKDFEYVTCGLTNRESIQINKYCGSDATVKIPEKIDGKIVRGIGDYAFWNNKAVKEVVIPNSVKTIGEKAFLDCKSLKKVVFGSGLISIGDSAFSGDKALEKVALPDSLTSIGNLAFAGCTSLSSVKLGSKLNRIGGRAFENTKFYNTSKNWKNNVLYIGKYLIDSKHEKNAGKYTVNNGTVLIAADAFRFSNITSLVVPDSVKYINEYAFSECGKLKTINLGKNIISIGSNAFLNTAYSKNSKNYTGDALYIGKYLVKFKENSKAKKVTVKNGTTLIADSAFNSNAGKLKEVVLPKSMRYIGTGAFGYRYNLEKINFPEGLKEIGGAAFSNCSKLKTVSLPKSLKKIGDSAFKQCSSIEKFSVHKDNTAYTAYKGALLNKKKTELMYYPAANKAASFKVPGTVTVIKNSAFYKAANLQDIVLNEKLKYIESYAFYECPGLRQLIVPKGVKAIDYKAIGFRAGKGFVIYAVKGGIAEEYARANINNEEASYNPRNFKLLCDKHSYKNVPELAATYSAPGHTAYRYCPKCGVKLGYVETPQLKLKKADGVKISYGETSIKISWNKVKGATNYRIYMYDAKAKKYVIVSKDFTKTSYTFKNLKPGTDYKFAVAPYCKEISNSSGKTVINAATRPVGLSKVKIKKLSKTSAELSWCKVKNADGYRIYRYDAKKDKYVKVTDTTKLNYTFKNLKKGESYKYAVRPYVKADGVVIQSVQMKKLTVKM